MKIAIILNSKRVTEKLRDQLNSPELSEKHNLTYDLFIDDPENIVKLLTSLNLHSYNAFIVGGGDGTVSIVVNALLKTKIPLAILPIGSFNILAKSLGFPNDIDEVLRLVKNYKTKEIDIAEANSNIIVNHAWIGFYYYMLQEREKYQDMIGTNRVFKGLFNLITAFKSLHRYTLKVVTDNKATEYQTSLIFISNNESKTGILNFGEHKYFATGMLYVTILNCKNRWQLFLFMFYAGFLKKYKEEYVTHFTTDNLIISSKKNIVKIVIDGELYQMTNPLKFNVLHNELTVITP